MAGVNKGDKNGVWSNNDRGLMIYITHMLNWWNNDSLVIRANANRVVGLNFKCILHYYTFEN
jgi:hypothetical protein